MDLYSYVPPLGANTPISVEPFPVDDSVPTEDNIEGGVKRLRKHHSGGPSGMWAAHLQVLLAVERKKEKEEVEAEEETTESNRRGEATEDMSTEVSNWEMVLELIHTEFR